MTKEQLAHVKQQVARRREAMAAFQREDYILRAMLAMHDARFGTDPTIVFDEDTLSLREREPEDRSANAP